MTGFLLTQEAKKGDPFAQHELGLRYLLGRGFAPDTIMAVEWIRKAANQKLAAAQFNYAIMLINGLGTSWNPFEAFERFKFAAESKMPEAQYMYGSLLTDNLIVNKDMTEAYRWIKKASDAGYEPADEALKSMMESGIVIPTDPNFNGDINAKLDSSALSNFSGALNNNPIELDFYDFSSDSITNDEKLIKEIFEKSSEEVKSILGIRNLIADTTRIDTTVSGLIRFASESGSPEALILEAKEL
jgi:TPR repeat protein